MISIKSYNKQELSDFIHGDLFRQLENIPISFHRALSQIQNPFAAEEDTLLWAAYEGGILAGYVGVLPDVLHVHDKTKKIYWLSCFWVENAFKDANLASQLFFTLIKRYKNQLFVSNFLFNLENTYQSLGVFQPTQYKTGNQFYIYPDFYPLLKAKWGQDFWLTKFYRFLEPLIIWNVKINLDVNYSILKKKNSKEFSFQNVSTWDNELTDFQSECMMQYTLNKRNKTYFEWVLTYPWLKNNSENIFPEKYYFSSYTPDFENIIIKIYKKGILTGWALLVIKNKAITLKYIFSKDDIFKEISTYILNLSFDKKVHSIICYDDRINHFLQNDWVFFCYKKNIKKAYLFPKNAEISHTLFQEGDGDSVFT